MEGFAAGAGVLGVRVVDRETLTLNSVSEVDRCTAQIGNTHTVDNNLDAVEGTDSVSVERAVVEVQLVDQAGTAAGLHSDAQAQVVATLLRQEALHLRSCDVGEDNLVGGSLSCGLGHGAPYDAEKTYALDTLLPPSHLAPGVGCALSVTRCARCAAQLPPV